MTAPIQFTGGPKIGAPAGNALPPYLQTRTPQPKLATPGNPVPTAPAITPKSTAVPGEVAQASGPMKSALAAQSGPPVAGPAQPSAISPSGRVAASAMNPAAPSLPPQQGGTNLQDVYNFFKSDLQNQTKQALANTTSDAAARGVYYGSPLTGSEADINTQYLRGLGQLQAGMFGNEQQLNLAALGLGANLNNMAQFGQQPIPGVDTNLFSSLGQLLGMNNPATNPQGGSTVISAPRKGTL